MAARSSWKGYFKISLVSMPVKAYAATSDETSIQLNQLHEKCHNRIKYKKFCPEHGEVPNHEIVSGYEYEKGQYAVIDVDQIELLRSQDDRSINVDCFIPADGLDAVYESDSRFYLVPNDPVGQKPYALIRDAMAESGLHAIAQVVIGKKEQVVRIRPLGKLLAMTVLHHAPDVKQASSFEDELDAPQTDAAEMKLAVQLMEGLRNDQFDISKYPDKYTERLRQVIEAKVAGKELVSPNAGQAPVVINLMDALKASVQQVKVPSKPVPKDAPPPRQTASRKTKREAAEPKAGKTGKKKTG